MALLKWRERKVFGGGEAMENVPSEGKDNARVESDGQMEEDSRRDN